MTMASCKGRDVVDTLTTMALMMLSSIEVGVFVGLLMHFLVCKRMNVNVGNEKTTKDHHHLFEQSERSDIDGAVGESSQVSLFMGV